MHEAHAGRHVHHAVSRGRILEVAEPVLLRGVANAGPGEPARAIVSHAHLPFSGGMNGGYFDAAKNVVSVAAMTGIESRARP